MLRLRAKKKPIKVEINEMKNSKVLPRLLRKFSSLEELIRKITTRTRMTAMMMYISIFLSKLLNSYHIQNIIDEYAFFDGEGRVMNRQL